MSTDIHLELETTISGAVLQDCLRAAGATVDRERDDPNEFSGEFPTSRMAFLDEAYPSARPLRAEHAAVRPMISSGLWLRPTSETYEAATADMRLLAVTLARMTGRSFVMSNPYDEHWPNASRAR